MFKFNAKFLLVLLLIVALMAGCTAKVEEPQPTKEQKPAQQQADEKTKEEYAHPESLISAKELKEIMDDENVVIVGVMVKGKYIPGSVNLKEKDFNTELNGVPDMRPTPEIWVQALSNYGIDNDDTIVLYDTKNMLLSARVWWIFKYYGHENVKILNGGINAWKNAGFNTDSTPAERKASSYEIKGENPDVLATLDTIKTSYDNENIITLDTRSEKEWKKGRIPGAVWVEWTNAISEDGTFKSASELKALYEGKGVTADKDLIMPYCLGGWRAANSMFVLSELLGYENVKNYDGSWAEFGESGEPIEK
ncbi:sulfurtransferase [Paramaledivibacter caminithermalis]|jgi:thiosulfate/3-mercaptopyruvate sulfurtransferase|uniref:Sulfurtransferase n=1 Tax=Paramaledivibacter caminithermalis (strain DSM 15212 / CIP 107654 / DViRD3) TaxID=1121301 RepID=A0A1M6MYF8_PARC5|nr:sulfurtransferase [Paramaledivibacter caminithermalis]SHJ88497.1 thiosulfate/3-mercaptopyruvate sulfurtransferase [Paramaledivibacter caminithermalis DSM 15212]